MVPAGNEQHHRQVPMRFEYLFRNRYKKLQTAVRTPVLTALSATLHSHGQCKRPRRNPASACCKGIPFWHTASPLLAHDAARDSACLQPARFVIPLRGPWIPPSAGCRCRRNPPIVQDLLPPFVEYLATSIT